MQWRNSRRAWGIVSVALHWLTAGLFVFQVWLGITMVVEPDLIAKFHDYQLHKSVGITILGLAMVRLGWVLLTGRPDLPASMPEGERRVAKLSHLALYGLLLAIPLTGWALVSASPLMVPTVWFGQIVIPHLPVGVSIHVEQTFSSIHAILGTLAIGLVGAHSLAALRHHFHHRDPTLRRMLRPGDDGEG